MTALKEKTELVSKFLEFMDLAEKLKCTLRHDWTSSGRQESVAEHSWRLALMVMLMAPHLSQPIEIEKALKMAIVHDICETVTGDIPYFEAPEGSEAREDKKRAENKVINDIFSRFGPEISGEIYHIWLEYEEGVTFLSKVVKSLDKLESQMQQLLAKESSWSEDERKDVFSERLISSLVEEDVIIELAKTVMNLSRKKVAYGKSTSKGKIT